MYPDDPLSICIKKAIEQAAKEWREERDEERRQAVFAYFNRYGMIRLD